MPFLHLNRSQEPHTDKPNSSSPRKPSGSMNLQQRTVSLPSKMHHSSYRQPWYRRLGRTLNTLAIIALVLFLLSFAWFNVTGYYNPVQGCHVTIHSDIVYGNKQSIKQAIRQLQNNDNLAYQDMCRYVDRIYERYCPGSDWHVDGARIGTNEPGCYIKGSHVIYVNPYINQQTTTQDERASAIKKYSRLAREYWDNSKD